MYHGVYYTLHPTSWRYSTCMVRRDSQIWLDTVYYAQVVLRIHKKPGKYGAWPYFCRSYHICNRRYAVYTRSMQYCCSHLGKIGLVHREGSRSYSLAQASEASPFGSINRRGSACREQQQHTRTESYSPRNTWHWLLLTNTALSIK